MTHHGARQDGLAVPDFYGVLVVILQSCMQGWSMIHRHNRPTADAQQSSSDACSTQSHSSM